MAPAGNVAPTLVVAAMLTAAAAAVGSTTMAFVGFDDGCYKASNATARFYAANLDRGAEPATWALSTPAPLTFPVSGACLWSQRPGVDRAGGRAWHVAGVCPPVTASAYRVVTEWAVPADRSAPPVYVGACNFTVGPGSRTGELELIAFDTRVFAGGPYILNGSDGYTVVGLTIPPDPTRAVTTLDTLPACITTAVTRLQLPAAPTSTGIFAADDSADTALAPFVLHLGATAGYPAPVLFNATALSPVTGEVIWTSQWTSHAPSLDYWLKLHIFRRRFVGTIWWSIMQARQARAYTMHGWANSTTTSTGPEELYRLESEEFLYGDTPLWTEPDDSTGTGDWPLLMQLAVGWQSYYRGSCYSGGVGGTMYEISAPSPAGLNMTTTTMAQCPLPAPSSCMNPAFVHWPV